MKRAHSRPRVAILGCGRVGRALAAELLYRGHRAIGRGELRVWSRSSRSVRRLQMLVRDRSRRLRVLRSAGDAPAEADVLLLCIADDGIASVVRELAKVRSLDSKPVVLITNGYLPLAHLAPLERKGWAIGRSHPLNPVPAGQDRTSPLHQARFAIEGDARAVRAAMSLVRGFGGIPFLLARRRGSAQAYHAGASLLCGGLVALFHQCECIMGDSFRSPAEVRPALAHLVGSTLWYTWTLGPEKALTGALSRGSEALVRGHLKALRKLPEALELYRVLGATMLALARSRGSLDERTERRLFDLLNAKQAGQTRRLRRVAQARG